jgi:hypothetical protein
MVLIVFHQYTPAIDDVSRATSIHEYSADIRVISRLKVIGDERKTDLLVAEPGKSALLLK